MDQPKLNANYHCKFLLFGFTSKFDQIVLDNEYSIRKGSIDELNEYYARDSTYNLTSHTFFLILNYNAPYKKEGFFPTQMSEAFLSFNFFSAIFTETLTKAPNCILYGETPVSKKISSLGFYQDGKISKYSKDIFSLDDSNINEFKSFWSKSAKLLKQKNTPLRIAARRFTFCNDRGNQEDKIIDLMIAYEALFLSETAELSYRLSLRVSRFLATDFDSNELFNFIKKSYDLRSKIVHGSYTKSIELKINNRSLDLKDVNNELYRLLRIVLRKYISEYNHLSISKLIEEIDFRIVHGEVL